MSEQTFEILIVEDDPDIADLLAMMIEEGNVVATIAENGKVAVKYLLERDFDLAICDLWMPEMDGLALLDWCAEHRPDLPTAVLTAQHEAKSNVEGRPNVNAWLLKPFSLEHQAKLENLIKSLRNDADPD